MRTSVRLWKSDGGLVLDGDPAAEVLAYGRNDEVSEQDEAEAAKLQPKDPAETKQAPVPPNKQARKTANK